MSEIKPLAKVVILALIIGILALLVIWAINPGGSDGKLAVRDYHATISDDGKLVETYTYDVGVANKYHMLFRSWEAPLSVSPLTVPYIQFSDMTPPPDMVGYMKDNKGTFTMYGSHKADAGRVGETSTANWMNNQAETNEAGFFLVSGDFLNPGTYTVTYTWQIYPPLEYDSQWTHLNLKLAGTDHVSYKNVLVSVPAAYAERMYFYPPSLKTAKNGNTVEITGSVATNENLAVEFLIPNAGAGKLKVVSGTPTREDSLPEKTAGANFWYTFPYTLATFLKYFGMAAVLATPFLLIVFYLWTGREKKYTVPAYLSTTPDTAIKPWQVNFLFKNDAGTLDKDAFYATLLELQRRKMITITEKADQKHLEIRVLSAASTDVYEKQVLDFLTTYADNGVFDTENVEALTRGRGMLQGDTRGIGCGIKLRNLLSVNPDPSLLSRYINDNRRKFRWLYLGGIVMILAGLVMYVFNTMLGYLVGPAIVLWIVVLVQICIAENSPLTLFGTWKDDTYQRKLEWDSFKHFLADLAMIKKYAPADLAMWGEWLVYGTALGVGETVEKAMTDLSVPLSMTGISSHHSRMLLAFAPMAAISTRSQGGHGGGGHGGGHGGGGGFGGGGAGGR